MIFLIGVSTIKILLLYACSYLSILLLNIDITVWLIYWIYLSSLSIREVGEIILFNYEIDIVYTYLSLPINIIDLFQRKSKLSIFYSCY